MTSKRHLQSAISLLSLFVAIFAVSVSASAEWKEKVLYSFQGTPDGLYPIGALAFDKAGNLYGATSWGGVAGWPTHSKRNSKSHIKTGAPPFRVLCGGWAATPPG
jgi:hypothetical protein